MWVELADNIFQTGVLAITALCAMLFALRTGVRSFWILTFAYTSFALGTLYYVLHLALVGYVPQVFYVSEVSWLAAHLFFFSRELLYTEGNRVGFSPIPALCGVLVAATAVVVDVFGPSPLVKGAFAIVAGGDVYLALWRLRAKIGGMVNAICQLCIPVLQVALFVVSGFTKDYSHFGLYYIVDILLTADLVALLPVTCLEGRRP